MPRLVLSRLGFLRIAAGALALAAFGSVMPSASAQQAAAGQPGASRIWFYRDFEPSVSLNLAAVYLNGALTGYVQPDGSAFYRDVAPGRYHITVGSYGVDVNQSKDIDLGPGQEAYVKILASDNWESTGGDVSTFRRDTFYVSLVPPQTARAEISTRRLTGG